MMRLSSKTMGVYRKLPSIPLMDKEAREYRRLLIRNLYPGFGMQTVHTPYSLCKEIIGSLVSYAGGVNGSVAVLFNVEFIEVLVNDFGVPAKNITLFTDMPYMRMLALGYGAKVVTVSRESLIGECKMKFDVVLGNPPFQSGIGEKDSIWHKFIEKSATIVKENGYISLVHPAGWRYSGSYSKAGKTLKDMQIMYLEMHGNKDGRKVFGASTCYDWYVAKNTPNNCLTTIKDRDGLVSKVQIRDIPVIPNSMMEKVISLFAKPGEQAVDLLFSYSAYEPRQKWMSNTKNGHFVHPCVYSVNTKNELSIKWSCKDEEHFGIPKIIIGDGCNFGIFPDKSGDYGMTQWAFGIIDDIENFDDIIKALESKEFQKINVASTTKNTAGIGVVDRNIIKYFRKDFWKEFI